MQNILEKFRLDGKVALITGGADGIGREIAIAFGQAGAKIGINDLSEEKLEAAKEVYKKHGIDIFTVVFNVANEEEVGKGIEAIKKMLGI